MKTVKKIMILASIFCVLIVSGCGSQKEAEMSKQFTEGLDQLGEIHIVSREEGSGTRSTFAEMVDFQKNDEGRTDLTSPEAQIADNAEAVMDVVENDASAIGYISLGALENAGNIKALAINGKRAGAGEKAYPLQRTFYLAYSGKLSAAEQDFLTYIHGEGQEIVAGSYTPVAKSSSFLSGKPEGEITVGGSTSVAPLMEALAEGYMARNPNVVITVEASDSTDGLTKAMEGTFDIGMSSRDLKDYEKELLDYEAIAEDEIAVIVNADNPLEDISLETLKRIFTGEIQSWEELNQ